MCESATSLKRKAKSHHYCCVPQCKNYYFKNISRHGFLVNKNLRKQWQILLRINKNITTSMKVCSSHFDKDFILSDGQCKKHSLKKSATPSKNLPVRKFDRATHELPSQRDVLLQKRLEQSRNAKEAEHCLQAALTLMTFSSSTITEKNGTATSSTSVEDSLTPILETDEKGIQVNTFVDKLEFDIADVINTKFRIRFCTSISNLKLFNVMANYMEIIIGKKKFCAWKQILLTLMKLKLELTFRFLSILFNVSDTLCRTYFLSICKVLSGLLRKFIRFPLKEEVLGNMPKCFKNYRKCRMVIDCSEVVLQKSKCLKCRIRTYSLYKKDHTLKFLIGVSPSGMITFLNKAYGGRASDKSIFNKEDLIKVFEPGQNAIMMDRDFLIDKECSEHFIQLIRPPFLSKHRKQFTKKEAEETVLIARARIHVERRIQRLKSFAILRHKYQWSLLPVLNDM